MEIAEKDRRLWTRDHQDEEHKEQETKHVVGLWGPDGIEDEEELDEDAAKWKDTTHYDAWEWLCVYTLLRDLPGDLVGAHWVF